MNKGKTMVKPQPGILDITPYKGGKSRIPGKHNALKLSSNENPFGPSPKAIAALCAAASEVNRYPSDTHDALRAALGRHYDLDPQQIICGAGSDELISFICQAFAGPGDEVIYPAHGFAMYRIYALSAGATPVVAREENRCVSVRGILEALSPRTRLVFLANPANPTATMIDIEEVRDLAKALPENVLLVLDGAYAEYVEGFDGGAEIVKSHANAFMLRTFSKLYGMGGLRIGWGYGALEIIDILNRVRGPFNLGSPQLAAAEAALEDTEFVAEIAEKNRLGRSNLTEGLRKLGIQCDDSYANFVLARFADQMQREKADQALQGEGIIVRAVAGYGLPEALRITVGRPQDVVRVLGALENFMEKQNDQL